MLSKQLIAIAISSCLLAINPLFAADWLTFGGDPQRTGWAKEESLITKKNVGSLALMHAVKLNNEPRRLNGLTAAVVKDWNIIPQGGGTMIDIAVVGGSSDKVFAINVETGEVIWEKDFGVTEEERRKSKTYDNFLCPKAQNATPTIEAVEWMKTYVYAIASNGKLYGLDIRNSREIMAPVQFVPPFAKTWSLNSLAGVIYTATSPGCGNDPAAVYAFDTRNPKSEVRKFVVTSGGGGIWGRAGVAIDPETGKIYAETGDGVWDPARARFGSSVISLTHELGLADYYTPSNYQEIKRRDWDMGSMSPVVFDYKGRKLVAASGKESVIYLLDADQLGGQDHRTPLFKSPRHSNSGGAFSGHGMWGAFATWENSDGKRWLYVPSWGPLAPSGSAFKSNGEVRDGAILAFKVMTDEKSGTPTLQPAWASRNMQVPDPPVIANGVVFALSTGSNEDQVLPDGTLDEERHKKPKGNAALYAFNALSGEELWSSGNSIKGWTHFSGLAVANGRIFVTTYDGTLYIFGIK